MPRLVKGEAERRVADLVALLDAGVPLDAREVVRRFDVSQAAAYRWLRRARDARRERAKLTPAGRALLGATARGALAARELRAGGADA